MKIIDVVARSAKESASIHRKIEASSIGSRTSCPGASPVISATADNNRVSAPPSAALRFATVLGPGTLSKRLIAFAFLLRADARRFGI